MMLCARVTKEQAEKLPPLSSIVRWFERERELGRVEVVVCEKHNRPILREFAARKISGGFICLGGFSCVGRHFKPPKPQACLSCGGLLESEESKRTGVCFVCRKTTLSHL